MKTKKDTVLLIRITTAEKKRINEKAREIGLTVTDLIMHALQTTKTI
jgi:NRPS condensation-like uncharacterized protein